MAASDGLRSRTGRLSARRRDASLRRSLVLVYLLALAACGGEETATPIPDAAPEDMAPAPAAPLCSNGRDDDRDGRVDLVDPGCEGPEDGNEVDPERPPACGDGLDNDFDGLIDYPADPDCAAAGTLSEGPPPACANDADDDDDGLVDLADPGCVEPMDGDEADPAEPPACADGIDNDLDGAIDLDDSSCPAAGWDDEGPGPTCANGLDDDGDGLIDDADPGCEAPLDGDETDPPIPPDCADGLDGDGDGLIDLDDPDCERASGDEGPRPACRDRRDNDGDGRVDRSDPGCVDEDDDDEADPEELPACANGLDDDGDGAIDYPADPECAAAGGPDEGQQPACADGLDSDDDGLIDLDDPGCTGLGDDDEADPQDAPVCANGEDDDGDGAPDYPADADCAAAGADSEGPPAACGDGLDNDGDGRIDGADPGCVRVGDRSEDDPARAPVCADGVDNDGDGAIDFPDDADCARAAGGSEGAPPACANGRDDDGDGALDALDPGCAALDDDDERDPAEPPACANGLDDDGDGRVDFPLDPDCAAAGADSEGPGRRCANGVDDDRDGAIDLDDPGCVGPEDDDEADPAALPACANGEDDDLDGLIDRADPGCAAAGDRDEGPVPRCANGFDDDDDGRVDLLDPGCVAPFDDAELDPARAPRCANGIDDDGDGASDFPADPDCAAAGGDDEGPARACRNGLDDDADGRIDRLDPGCADAADDDEADPEDAPACANGIDDDLDGAIDYPLDAGCAAAGEQSEGPLPACANGEDDDGDGRVDRLDPGCAAPADDDETDPAEAPACANGEDDDGDGLIDLADGGCATAGDDDEGGAPACSDGVDGDGDGLVDLDDPGCAGPFDVDEADPAQVPLCANGEDDDGDGLVDRADPGCPAAGGDDEGPRPVCANGEDDDGDGRIDLADPGCRAAIDGAEDDPARPPACGDGLDNDLDGLVDYPDDPECTAAGGPSEGPAPRCANGLDDDEDGRVDRADPGCVDARDDDELDPAEPPVCANGLDDDGDGRADFPADPGCAAAGAPSEGPPTACSDGLDDDGDGLIDLDDPGCRDGGDADEADPELLPACADGLDNDLDGLIDHPDDPTCLAAGGEDEGPSPDCANGLDDDDDGRIDLADPGCVAADDADEGDLPGRPVCADGLDNDGDGRIDFPADPECAAAGAPRESPVGACDNRVDDDGDGRVDLDDPGCADIFGEDEADPDVLPRCADGRDNDFDGFVDHPDDPNCPAAGAESERSPCAGVAPAALDLEAVTVLNVPAGDAARAPDCGGGQGAEAVAALRAIRPGRYTVEVAPRLAADTVVVAARAACDVPDEIDCVGPAAPAVVQVDLAAGEVAFIVVQWAPGGPRGAVEVSVDLDPIAAPACADGLDNDGDGRVDLDDPGCVGRGDDDEQDPPEAPLCANGRDDDRDGAIDFPFDPECAAAGAASEAFVCVLPDAEVTTRIGIGQTAGRLRLEAFAGGFADGCLTGRNAQHTFELLLDAPARLDARFAANHEIDYVLDRDCFARAARCDRCRCETIEEGFLLPPGRWLLTVEASVFDTVDVEYDLRVTPLDALACVNGIDDDGDGRVDADDPGCFGAADADEADPDAPAPCSDGLDGDGDGLIDYPADPGCAAAGDAEFAGCPSAGEVRVVRAPGGMFELPATPHNIGGAPRHPGPCADGPGHQLRVVVTEPSRLTVESLEDASRVWLAADCVDAAADFEEWHLDRCHFAGSSALSGEALAPGEYWLFVSAGGPRTLDIDLAPIARACGNGLDDDGDGLIDDDDLGCERPYDDDEADPPAVPACANGVDDDLDGFIDVFDRDCRMPGDPIEKGYCRADEVVLLPPGGGEVELLPELFTGCGFDCDVAGEAAILVPIEAPSRVVVSRQLEHRRVRGKFVRECDIAGGTTMDPVETYTADRPGLWVLYLHWPFGSPARTTIDVDVQPLDTACSNGVDDDGDGWIDARDPGCADVEDDDEEGGLAGPACANRRDDDGDGLVDLADPGCVDPEDEVEGPAADAPACSNGLDDDADGLIDFPDDPTCLGPGGEVEQVGICRNRAGVEIPTIELRDEGGEFPLDYRGGDEPTILLGLSRPGWVTVDARTVDFDPLLFVSPACSDLGVFGDDGLDLGLDARFEGWLEAGRWRIRPGPFYDGRLGGRAGEVVLSVTVDQEQP